MDVNEIRADEFAASHLHDRSVEDDLQSALEHYIRTQCQDPKLENWLSILLRDFIVNQSEDGVSKIEVAALVDGWLKERKIIIPNQGVIVRSLAGMVETSYRNYREIKKNLPMQFDEAVTSNLQTQVDEFAERWGQNRELHKSVVLYMVDCAPKKLGLKKSDITFTVAQQIFKAIPLSEDLADTYWDEYTNQMTQLSWAALSDYLNMRHEVIGIRHTAFLIDIAERNCIRIGEALREEIVKHAVKDRMIDYGFAVMKNFHRTTFWDTVSKPILRILNVGFYKDAFVRV